LGGKYSCGTVSDDIAAGAVRIFFKAPPPKLRILDMQLWGVCVKKCKLLQKAAVP